MWLSRSTPDPFEDYKPSPRVVGERSEDFRASTNGEGPVFSVVVVDFPRYGNGKKRQSDFEVTVQWEDVEKILEKFCEAAHPEALAMRSAARLAAAVRELGWQPPESVTPQSN